MPVPPGRIDSIAWILNHYYPKVDPAFPLQGTPAQMAAAVQTAIWHYSDGFELQGENDPVIAANYAAILDAVPLNPDLGEPITSLALQTLDVGRVVGDIVPVTVRTTAVGRIVNVVVTDGERVDERGEPTSGPVGDGDVIFVRRSEAGTVKVAVDAHAQVLAGRIFMADPSEQKQAQILARTVTVNAKADLEVTYEPGAVVRVVKRSTGGDPATPFTFTVGAPGWQEPFPQMLTYQGTLEWRTGIRPGVAYEVREQPLPAGWRRELLGCDGGSPTLLADGEGYGVTPAAGQTVTCTFSNLAETPPTSTVPPTTTEAPPSTTVPPTTTEAPPSTTVPPTTTEAPPTTVAPTTTVATTVPPTSPPTTAACDSTRSTDTTEDDCGPEVVVGGVREVRGTVTTDLGSGAPGRLARTGSNRTGWFVGVAMGLVTMGGALHLLSRQTTVTPSFVYIGKGTGQEPPPSFVTTRRRRSSTARSPGESTHPPAAGRSSPIRWTGGRRPVPGLTRRSRAPW